MADRKPCDVVLIARYKLEAAARRKLHAKKGTLAPVAVSARDSVFTVSFGKEAEQLSLLGGVTEVLGRSRINIPVFRVNRQC